MKFVGNLAICHAMCRALAIATVALGVLGEEVRAHSHGGAILFHAGFRTVFWRDPNAFYFDLMSDASSFRAWAGCSTE